MESVNDPRPIESPDAVGAGTSPHQYEIFISYSHLDEERKNRLLTHLGSLKQEGLCHYWIDDEIRAGMVWAPEIDAALGRARMAILLITPDYLNSTFIKTVELPKTLQRKENGLLVYPIIAVSCAWEQTAWLSSIQVRPKNGKPVWADKGEHVDNDLAAITKEIADIIKGSPAPPSKGQWGVKPKPKPLNKYLFIIGGLILLALAGAFIKWKHDQQPGLLTSPPSIAFIEWHPDLYDATSLEQDKWDAPPAWKLEHREGTDQKIKALIVTGSEIGLMKLPEGIQTPSDYHVQFVIIVGQGQRSASWVVRAQDKQNYYLFTLTFPANGQHATAKGHLYSKGGQLSNLDMVKKQDSDMVNPLPYNQPFYKDDIISVNIDVTGGQFSHTIKLTCAEVTKSIADPTYNIDPKKITARCDDDVSFTFIDPSVHYPTGLFGFKAEPDDPLIIRDVDVKVHPPHDKSD